MAALVAKHRLLRVRDEEMRSSLGDRDRRIQQLSDQLRELNQRRQDAAKRIDDLIQQIEALDAKFARQERD